MTCNRLDASSSSRSLARKRSAPSSSRSVSRFCSSYRRKESNSSHALLDASPHFRRSIKSRNHLPVVQDNSQSTYSHASKRLRVDSLSSSRSCSSSNTRRLEDLPLEWWERAVDCKEAKSLHTERVDRFCESRERLVLLTTLCREDIVMELNMFPCKP
jgi:hypothetical protein